MTSKPIPDGVKPVNRYRLPGIDREGIAQLSLLETALWPLQGGLLPSSTFETKYSFQAAGERRAATVTVYAPLGLQSIDEYVLYGLLGISLSRQTQETSLLATPYWIIKRLGMAIGGFQYDQLRASLERLSAVAYQNTAFYNPVTQQHERVTFHFFSTFLPTCGRGGPVAADRAWKIDWSTSFFRMSQATGGTLLFDLDVYRTLTPASRRLFLKLKDRFWRSKRVFMNVDDLTINGLGFSSDRPLKKRKFDLTSCLRELLSLGIIEFGPGQHDVKDLFIRRAKGLYVVVFNEGEYFRQPTSERVTRQKNAIAEDPLYEPLRTIGVDEAAIRRLFKQHARGLIQRWIRITDTAMHEKPRGFPGFKVSPPSFLIDGIQNDRLPPDWIYAHDKEREREEFERKRAAAASNEESLRAMYASEKEAALREYLLTPEGQKHYSELYVQFLEFYRQVEPDRPYEAATAAATGKVEREHFQFPDFGVWLLERRQPTA